MKIETGFQARDIRKKQEFDVASVHFAMFTRVISRVRRTILPLQVNWKSIEVICEEKLNYDRNYFVIR